MIILFLFCTVLSALVVRKAISLALAHGITDRPGGHKQHDTVTPFVGGAGILAALLTVVILEVYLHPEHTYKWLSLGLGSLIIYTLGFIDDLLKLGYKIRFFVQIAVALIMVMVGGVVLTDLGELFPGLTFELGWFAIPFTVFATIGVINALNMVDGIDGNAGTLSFISFLLIGIMAFIAGDLSNFALAVALAGGVVGFLVFNLRYAAQRRAKVFLGDNGSMLLGFLFAWLLIALSQEPSHAMAPVTAIWLFSIPLMDTMSVVIRRAWLRKSPFAPDHNHLHHILLHAGFRIEDAVFVIASIHFLMGGIGMTGFYLNIPEFVMLLGFVLIYLLYFYVTVRPWYFIMGLRFLHTMLGLTPAENRGIFLGSYTAKEAEGLVRMVSTELGPSVDSWVQVLEKKVSHSGLEKRYAVAVNIRMLSSDSATAEEVEHYVALLQGRMKERHNIQVREFFKRDGKNDRRVMNQGNAAGSEIRITERRNPNSELLVFEVILDKLVPDSSQLSEKEKLSTALVEQSTSQSALQQADEVDE
jgi:UDP-GlcNAc:undecaprenyl-phosphate/decaprenyl-phosphate GlcNAc-1-phosphate transferase